MKLKLLIFLAVAANPFLCACAENSPEFPIVGNSYNEGYTWAKEIDVNNFADCQKRFGTGEAEDGCNKYVKENHTGNKTFKGYECTEDCSGHEAGYEWAQKKGIVNPADCGGNSQSFRDGCKAYANENY